MSYWSSKGWIHNKEGVPFGTIQLWGENGGSGELHLISLLFVAWAAAMVSKTLKIPKL
jgi:CDP-diacylglycerol--serine O-phosphatidyltransferase